MSSKMKPRILLATPVFDQKEYAVPQWLEADKLYTHEHDTLMVDNSATPDFFERLKTIAAPSVLTALNNDFRALLMNRVATPGGEYFAPLTQAAEHIRKFALVYGYDYWLNIDVDEWGDPDLIDYLLELIGDADVLAHASPNRQLNQWIDGGFGCVMFNRRTLMSFSFDECPPTMAHDVWFFRYVRGYSPLDYSGLPEIKIKQTRGTRILNHQDGMCGEKINAFPDGKPYQLTVRLT